MNGDAPTIFRVFVPVTDFSKAIGFYQQLFNNDGRLIHKGRQYFDCGPVIFAVIESNGAPIGDHVYFSVPNLEAVFSRAEELGCLETADVHGSSSGEINVRPWGERSFYCRDPFGNGLCFVDEKTLFTGER
ncbi:MAG: VOC family protein [Pyrinomonadaceae bacterium]